MLEQPLRFRTALTRGGDAAKELLQGAMKDRAGRGGLGEERHRRMELEVVRRAEDLPDGAAFAGENEPGALDQARAEHGMREVGAGLVQRRDCEVHGGGAGAEAAALGKDEPHPVSLFAAGGELHENAWINALLRADEAIEVERVRCGHVLLQMHYADRCT